MKHVIFMTAVGATVFTLQGAGLIVLIGWAIFVFLVGKLFEVI